MTDPEDNKWTIPDLIDFELWVREEIEVTDASKAERRKENQTLYAASNGEQRRDYFLRWVRAKRTVRHSNSESVGTIAHSGFNASALAMGLLGAILGFSVVAAFFSGFLRGTGEASPINVVSFAAACIFLPFLLTVGALVIWLSGLSQRPATRSPTILRLLYWPLIKIPLERAIQHAVDKVNSRTEFKAASLMGDLKALLTSRKSLLSNYFAVWIQALGVGYAIALPLAILWKNATSSQDYNWETNFEDTITPERFHSVVSGVAAPWAWWKGSADGVPSLTQIRATEHVKYASQTSETADAWGVWATFLLLASTTYVTAPRLALCVLSVQASRKRLQLESFEEARFDELAETLTRPILSWEPQDSPIRPVRESDEGDYAPSQLTGKTCFIAIPEDLSSENLIQAVRAHFEKLREWRCTDTAPLLLPSDPTKLQVVMSRLPNLVSPSSATRFVMIEDAGAPPVLAQIHLLQSIRTQLGGETGIVVALLGPSSDDPLGDPPARADLEAWELKIRAIGDPNIRVLNFHADLS